MLLLDYVVVGLVAHHHLITLPNMVLFRLVSNNILIFVRVLGQVTWIHNLSVTIFGIDLRCDDKMICD